MRVLLLSLLATGLWAQLPSAKPAGVSKPTAAKPAAGTSKPAAKPEAVPQPTADPADPVVFQAGSEKWTRSQFESFVANLPDQVRSQMSSPAGKRQMAERLGELKNMAQEARRRSLPEKPVVRQQLALQSDNVLASALIQEIQAEYKPSEEALKSYYDAHLGDYEQAKARHILVRFKGSRVPLKTGQKDLTEEEALAKAQELKGRLDKGEDFAALAKAESDDTGSGAQGGDLGSFARGRMVPEFEKAVFSQPVKVVGDPVRSMFGYHVIEVLERGARPFDEVKTEIEKKERDEGVQKALAELKKTMPVTLDETYFGPPEAASAAPGPRPAPGTPAVK